MENEKEKETNNLEKEKCVLEDTIKNLLKHIDLTYNKIINANRYTCYDKVIKKQIDKLLKDLCDILGSNYDKLVNAYQNDILNDVTTKILRQQLDNPTIKKSSSVDSFAGTKLFEPFLNDSEENKVKDDSSSDDGSSDDDSSNDSSYGSSVLLADRLKTQYELELKNREEQKRKEDEYNKTPEKVWKIISKLIEKHKYKFVDGKEGINPAVEVELYDNLHLKNDVSLMNTVCNYVKENGGFNLVTATTPEDSNRIIFYLVLK